MNISFFELFLTLIVGQCIFLIFAIQYIPKKNTGTNSVIQYLLAIYSFYLIERILGSKLEMESFRRYGYLYNVFYLLIGPFIYTYMRRLLFNKNDNYSLPYYHFLPAILYFIYAVFHTYFFTSIKDNSYYGHTSFLVIEISFFISITAYLVTSYGLFNYYKKKEAQELSFHPNSTKYIQVMLVGLTIYMSFWLLGIFELLSMVTWIERPLIYDISCLIFGLQIFAVSFYNLKHPEIFKVPYPLKTKNANKKQHKLGEKEVLDIKSLVDEFFEEDKGYRQVDLSLSILADKINTTNNKLSWVLNNSYGKNFYELVNQYRIEEFAQKIKDDRHKEYTLVSIAYEVGFKSKSTFNKAFKEITKLTPTQYIKTMESEKGVKTSV
ncbi:MAG: helix-turn-helix domain-containing protein [Bacteroidota bacterium]